MSDELVITIDGPAASGKTSVSRELAARLGWDWVSTGAFYRGLGYIVQAQGLSLDDEEGIANLIENEDWEVRLSPEKTLVFYRGNDVTEKVYQEEAGGVASKISQYPKVREILRGAQRDCAKKNGKIIAEGRDCGTVVFPQAQVKLYITARSQDRAARRAEEQGRDVEATRAAQAERDAQDTQRKASPLKIPENAHVIDTTEMDLEAVVDQAEAIVKDVLGL